MSFLRDTKGMLDWSLRDLSRTLNISREEAERVVTLLQLQGYVQAAHKAGEWITTPSGDTVSGAKTPRFDRETVEAALTSLKQRILDTNQDRAAKFQITRAVAFGDFLAKDRSRVQTAEVGIALARRDKERNSEEIAVPHSAAEAREEHSFLRQLRGRSALINLKPYSEWMGTRTHQKLF
jgi:DNA-binding transcriptional MocR family regulator